MAKAAAASRAPVEEEERDYTVYVDKKFTPLQTEFHDWVLEKTGVDPATYKTKAEAFAEGLRLSMALRSAHQASPENQESIARRRAAAAANGAAEEDEVPASRKAAKTTAKAAPAPVKKAAAKKAARPAPAPEPEEDEEEAVVEEPQPKRAAKKAVRRGARPVVTDEEAPF